MSKDIQCPFCNGYNIGKLPYQDMWFCYCHDCDQEWVE